MFSNNIVIQEVDEQKDFDEEIDTSTISSQSQVAEPQKVYPTVPAFNPYSGAALTLYDPLANTNANTVPASIKQQVKQTDDSATAYGEQYTSSFGNRKFAPTMPSAPALDDEEWAEYQAWLNAPTFADRQQFPNHKQWNDIITQNQDEFRIQPSLAFADTISQNFRKKVLEEKESALLLGHGLPPTYNAMIPFEPVVFEAQKSPASSAAHAGPRYIDQVQEMIDYAEEKHRMSYVKGKLAGQKIVNNQFIVVSDHGGHISGKKLQIWGGGVKESFTLASASANQVLGKVEGSSEYEITTDYVHVSNRFTIIRINSNEIGFVFNKLMNRIEKLSLGRFVIPEDDYAYIGKATLVAGNEVIPVIAHSNYDANIVNLAKQLQVVLVTRGRTAFVKNNLNTYMLPENPEPYVLDKRRGESFINYANLNQQIISASDGSYTFYNQLQPGQFVLLQHESKVVVWEYDENHPELNSLYLQTNQLLTDNRIHNTNENKIDWHNVTLINTMPGQVVVVRNKERQIRFVESNKAEMFVLRSPWQFVNFTSKNEEIYTAGSEKEGNETARVMLRSSEWVAVLNQSGHLSFYPPRMDGQPYYFAQPENLVIEVVDKNEPGEQKLDVPGIGIVSVVNIPSGQIGACRIRNMHFFLNPSPTPYIFMPPDVFLKMVDAKAAHTDNGDLHRVVLAPDEQAVIIKDGQLHRLPEQGAELKGENGVYIFRAGQFSFEGGGPRKKSDKNCQLGPIHSFIVGVGEKGYGTVNNQLKIWDSGQHYVDNRKDEWFTGFFTTNVDPVSIQDLPVTFKHGITGKINVFVSYHIDNPEKAIQQFKNHDILHEFIQTTTSSEMLKMCASRPPLGYTDLDFSTAQPVKNSETLSGSEKNAEEAVKEMQNSFLRYAETLQNKYGVSISDMYIHTWTLADDFVKQVQENAKSLQNAHAEVAQAQIALQKSILENQQAQQAEENKIALAGLENKKLALTLEANKLKQQSEAEVNAARKVAEAKANNEIKLADATALVATADQKALANSAEDRANAKAQADIAKDKLAAKLSETEAEKLDIGVQVAKGTAEAEISGKKEQARYYGYSPEQRLQLQLAEIQMQNFTNLVNMLVKTNTTMPGVFSLDPRILELYQMPAVASAQFNQRNVMPFSLFAPTTAAATPAVASKEQKGMGLS